MAESIKSSRLLKASSRLEPAAAPIRNPAPLVAPETVSASAGGSNLDPKTNRDDSVQFRAELLRRYDAPYTLAPAHGGVSR